MRSRLIVLSFLFVAFAFAQIPTNIQRYRNDSKGDYKNRQKGTMDGNRIRTIYFNNGEVGQWPYSQSFEWPKGSSHQYFDGCTFMVGAQITAPGNNQKIHPLEISYREEMPKDPVTGVIWGFEPVAGYSNPLHSAIAISNDVRSYPNVWPPALGVGDDWSGTWNGFFGKGAKDNVLETFFVMDDSKDGKYKRVPYKYYPIASDSERGGLGLRVEVRGLQFRHVFLNDILFWNYSVTNISDHDYDSTVFGIFMDPGIGGTNSGNDDAAYSSADDLCYTWDHSGNGDPQYGNWQTGYVGISIIKSPNRTNNRNTASVSITPLSDKGPGGVWPKNNEVMWRKMTGGFVDTGVTNSNISIVLAGNVFSFPKWTTEKFEVAMIMGHDLSDIIMKKIIAQNVSASNYVVPDDLSQLGAGPLTIQSPLGSSPISGNTAIAWTVPANMANAISYVYTSSNGGNDWSLLGLDNNGTKSIQWNTSLVPDGVLYKVRVISVSDNGVGYIDSDSFLTVNNSGNAKPEIFFTLLNPKTTLQGNYAVTWYGGDADGDSSRVHLFIKLSSESQWKNIVSNVPASAGMYLWDTKTVPNSSSFDYELRAEIISNTDTSGASMKELSIVNSAVYKPGGPYTTAKKSSGTGAIAFNVVDASSVTGHQYVLSFSYKKLAVKGAVTDLQTGMQKLSDIFPLDSDHESNTFDGLRLQIVNDKLEPDYAQSGWVDGTSTFPLVADYDSTAPSLNTRLPYDYQITFSNVIVDTSIALDPAVYPVIPIRFTVKNLTTNTKAYSLFQDKDGNMSVSKGDMIKIIDFPEGNLSLIWKLRYGTAESVAAEPTLGDVYVIKTKKPFVAGDSIVFTSQGLSSVTKLNMNVPSEYALSQNFPNPFNPATTIRFSIPIANTVELKIFDILGKEIITFIHEKLQAGEYSLRFDGSGLSSGTYIMRLQSGSTVQSKKLMLIK